MPEREEIVVGNPTPENTPPDEPQFDEAFARTRAVEVLTRGLTTDRLAVPNLPPHLYGEWVRDDPFQIEDMKKQGFWDGSYYAMNRATHGDGSVGAKVADVVYMVTHRRNKEIIDEERNRANAEKHAPKKGKQKEERDYEANVKSHTGGDIPATVNSQVHGATPRSIVDSLRVADQQTRPNAPT